MTDPKTSGRGGFDLEIRYPTLIDPNADWVLGSLTTGKDDFDDLGPGGDYFFLPRRANQTWLPILVGLARISVVDFAKGVQFEKHIDAIACEDLKKRWRECTHFYALDLEGPGETDPDFYCAPTVKKDFFVLLHQSEELRDVVTSVTLGLPLDRESLAPLPYPPKPHPKGVRP